MNASSHLLIDIGRILLGLIFFLAALMDIKGRTHLLSMLQAKNIPKAQLLLPATIALKLIAGLLVIFNLLTFIAAFALGAFTLIANCIFHNFWAYAGTKRDIEFVQFLTNLATVAGFIIIMGVAI